MRRYENSKIKVKITKRGQRNSGNYEITSNSTFSYSGIPENDDDIYVISQYGDRLDQLAFQFYNDVSLWWYIAKANNLSFMTIPPGTRLRIPANTKYAVGK
tara:strand:- start:466 stop:768 length:303 start_codon:yes stop_codon:yes gene_type:complete